MPSSKTLDRAIKSFRAGIPRRSPAIWTDGHVLYSYKMPIAYRSLIGRVNGDVGKATESITILDPSLAPSVTTLRHIRAAREAFPKAWNAFQDAFDRNLEESQAWQKKEAS
jgi:hypothetical protein